MGCAIECGFDASLVFPIDSLPRGVSLRSAFASAPVCSFLSPVLSTPNCVAGILEA